MRADLKLSLVCLRSQSVAAFRGFFATPKRHGDRAVDRVIGFVVDRPAEVNDKLNLRIWNHLFRIRDASARRPALNDPPCQTA